MGRLFEIVEAYRARYAPHEPSYSRIAEQVGVSRQTLLNWRTPRKLLDKKFLIALSHVTGVPYQRVLDALLEDIGYLREDQKVVVSPKRKRLRAVPPSSTRDAPQDELVAAYDDDAPLDDEQAEPNDA